MVLLCGIKKVYFFASKRPHGRFFLPWGFSRHAQAAHGIEYAGGDAMCRRKGCVGWLLVGLGAGLLLSLLFGGWFLRLVLGLGLIVLGWFLSDRC